MTVRDQLQMQVIELNRLLEKAGDDPIMAPQLRARLAEAKRELDSIASVPDALTEAELAEIENRCSAIRPVHCSVGHAPSRGEVRLLIAEIRRLRAAIVKHHDQKADDRCWMDDHELYAAAGLPDPDNCIGDPEAMLANCKRFITSRCRADGPWKSYAELEAENAALRTQIAEFAERIAAQSELLSRLAGKPLALSLLDAEEVAEIRRIAADQIAAALRKYAAAIRRRAISPDDQRMADQRQQNANDDQHSENRQHDAGDLTERLGQADIVQKL